LQVIQSKQTDKTKSASRRGESLRDEEIGNLTKLPKNYANTMVESSQNKRYVQRVQDGWWLEEKVYIYIYGWVRVFDEERICDRAMSFGGEKESWQ
jgi:hypothetical protein